MPFDALRRFFATESAGGAITVFAAVAAMWAPKAGALIRYAIFF